MEGQGGTSFKTRVDEATRDLGRGLGRVGLPLFTAIMIAACSKDAEPTPPVATKVPETPTPIATPAPEQTPTPVNLVMREETPEPQAVEAQISEVPILKTADILSRDDIEPISKLDKLISTPVRALFHLKEVGFSFNIIPNLDASERSRIIKEEQTIDIRGSGNLVDFLQLTLTNTKFELVPDDSGGKHVRLRLTLNDGNELIYDLTKEESMNGVFFPQGAIQGSNLEGLSNPVLGVDLLDADPSDSYIASLIYTQQEDGREPELMQFVITPEFDITAESLVATRHGFAGGTQEEQDKLAKLLESKYDIALNHDDQTPQTQALRVIMDNIGKVIGIQPDGGIRIEVKPESLSKIDPQADFYTIFAEFNKPNLFGKSQEWLDAHFNPDNIRLLLIAFENREDAIRFEKTYSSYVAGVILQSSGWDIQADVSGLLNDEIQLAPSYY